MKDLSVSSEEHFLNFIGGQIASGRYKNADEVIREGLQLLKDRQKISDDLKKMQEFLKDKKMAKDIVPKEPREVYYFGADTDR